MTDTDTLTLTATHLDALPERTLNEVAEVCDLRRTATTASVRWYDSDGDEWELTGHALQMGSRVLVWTSCDEAGVGDKSVQDFDDSKTLSGVAREWAEEIASDLGSLTQPVPDCTEPKHHWEPAQTGLAENPGVHGHGGGVRITHVCSRCGLRRTLDTWADDGHGGVCERTTYRSNQDDA